jgi:hypothetical protein
MKLPVLSGVVRRRILANYRMDPEVAARWVPAPLRPKLQRGHAVAGVCLIRLEEIKPQGLPCLPGITSENAAHRIAVEWQDADGRTREGVFIERRDSDSWLNQLAGGRIFPGRHGAARFEVSDDGRRIGFRMQGEEGLAIAVDGAEAESLPSSSVFADLHEASAFFEGGSLGYSRTDDPSRLDGMQLDTDTWTVRALALERLEASFFDDGVRFPRGSVVIDHALVMRDIGHRWVSQPDLACPCDAGPATLSA